MGNKMELTLQDYAKHLFFAMNQEPGTAPAHWESIRAKAQPLVEQLIALNDEMVNGGYSIIGHKVKGKKVLSKAERIRRTKLKMWGVEDLHSLKEGDYIWADDDDQGCTLDDDSPVRVEERTAKCIYIEVPHCGGEHIARIGYGTTVLKAPEDWDENEMYNSEEWWLEQADKLGI